MYLGPKGTACRTSRASTTRTTIIAALTIFLVYQVWSQHDNLNFKVVTILGQEQVVEEPMNNGIPKKIWYKLGPKGLSDDAKEWTESCLSQNPDYSHQFFTDASAEKYVRRTFSTTRPDIVDVYTHLTIPILKADLLRYLLLYTEGGVWSDLDVSCEGIPIDEWIPPQYRDNNTSTHNNNNNNNHTVAMVVGYEFDAGYSDYYFHEFATWTILARPGLSHMLTVINDIVSAVYAVQAANQVASLTDVTLPMVGDVVDFTGPRRFTRSVMRSVTEALGGVQPNRSDIENIRDPILLDNVLILPGNTFANATNKFDSLGPSSMPVLVTHHYAGSWKNDFGGEKADEAALPDGGSQNKLV